MDESKDNLLRRANSLGDRMGAWLKAHEAKMIPLTVAMVGAWAVGAFTPKWVGIIIGVIGLVMLGLVLWSASYEPPKDEGDK